MFRTVLLSIIRSFFSLYTQQWYMSYSFRAGPGCNCSCILVLLESCLQICMTYTIVECTVNKLLMMDRRNVRNLQSFMTKYICEISASSWFYYKEICYDARSHGRKIQFGLHKRRASFDLKDHRYQGNNGSLQESQGTEYTMWTNTESLVIASAVHIRGLEL